MEINNPALFFFSAIGAFNGLFLSTYFAFFIKEKNQTTLLLAATLLVVSIRVGKSVFLNFNPLISNLFIQIGLIACGLIGPFLFLYIKSVVSKKELHIGYILGHVLPWLIALIILSYYYPYHEFRYIWRGFLVRSIYTQWVLYILISFVIGRGLFTRLFTKEEKLSVGEVWSINVLVGIFIIWLAYYTSGYTSYIMGALTFSFIFYLSALLWFFKVRNNPLYFDTPIKYSNRKISESEARELSSKLELVFIEGEVFRQPNLKIADVASQLEVLPHYLSQFLNDNLGKSFSAFVNEYRVKAAEKLIKENSILTLEAIGKEAGFQSNSSFYSAFKKVHGVTPAQYKKSFNQ